jgi:predicted dehydrogenase
MAPESEIIRLAMIGCGAIARVHAQRLAKVTGASIAVCCDPENAAAFATQFAPDALVVTDAQQALSQPGLTGAILCSPTQAHHAQAKMALGNGLHVLCEKPLAANRSEILDLIAARDRAQSILAISYQRRYEAPYAMARQLIGTGDTFGRVRQIHIFVCERWQQTIQGTWRDDPKVGSGYFGDAGSHQVDIVFYITGSRPLAVYAESDRRGSNVEIVTRVLAKLTGGIDLCAHFVGDAHHFQEDIHFHAEKGDLLLRGERLYRAHSNRVVEIADLPDFGDPDRGFVDAIRGIGSVRAPADCALPMMDWTNAVLASIRSGQWVEIP